jgi:hypothetical protein
MRISPAAVKAIPTGSVERENDPVSFLDAHNRFACFIDHAHNFVTDDGAFFQRSASVIHMNIAAAYAAGGNSQNGVAWGLQLWFGMVRN